MTRSHGEAALRGRDYQREKVYHAERILGQMLDQALENPQIVVSGSTLVLPPEARFSSPETVQAYVDHVLAHPGVVERWGVSAVRVRKRKGARKAHYRLGEIAVPDAKWALRETVILHELSHHLDKGKGAAHGRKFAGTMLTLLGVVMGPETQLLMRILYGDGGVLAA
jgi:putative metallohydrolase (TIGR04338 family)